MKDICNFIQSGDSNINYYHFVYQAGFKKLTQPFCNPFSRMHIVSKGSGTLKIANNHFSLKTGSVFFTFPHFSYSIDGSDDLTYLYISFDGKLLDNLLEDMNISYENCHYHGYDFLLGFWMESIRRVSDLNSFLLTDSVFKYTLSHLTKSNESLANPKKTEKITYIIDYIENNYSNPNLSIGMLSDIFFYSEKYFSYIFKKEIGVNFTKYLNELRITKAINYIKNGIKSNKELAKMCGFSDPLYFLKVFKKITDMTPGEYIKSLK